MRKLVLERTTKDIFSKMAELDHILTGVGITISGRKRNDSEKIRACEILPKYEGVDMRYQCLESS